jgi:RHS repeat-associated protein
MDFLRKLLLVICISVFGISSSMATANDVGPPYTVSGVFYPTIYGMPTVEAAIHAGIQAMGNYPNFKTCQYFVVPDTGSSSTYAATVGFTGNTVDGSPCNSEFGWGGQYTYTSMNIEGTVYNHPINNAGSGCDCDGGAGNSDGGSSSSPGGAARNGSLQVGDPINIATGYTYLQEDDYIVNSLLNFRRFYNSGPAALTTIGAHWRHSFDRSLDILGSPSSPATSITLLRPDGRRETFTKSNGQWTSTPDVSDTFSETDNEQGVATGYTVFIGALRQFETYDANGLLQSVTDEYGVGITLTYSTDTTAPAIAPTAGLLIAVTDPEGRQLKFTYNSNGNLHQVTLPDGGTLTYTYDAATNNLLSVEYPDTKTRQYVYNESSLTGGANFVNDMTGIVDEAGVRYESTSYVRVYNDGIGQATSSSFAGNVGTTQITSYGLNGWPSVVKFPLGNSVSMNFGGYNSIYKLSGVESPCGPQCGQSFESLSYDANGHLTSTVDFDGNVTATTYDANGLLNQQIDASGTPSQRTTNTTWNTTLRVPLTRTVLDVNGTAVSATQWVYNSAGQTLARCEIDPTNSAAAGYACSTSGTVPAGVRRWTYTYCTAVDGTQCPLVGLLLTTTGPRTDVAQATTYSYYLDSASSGCPTPGGACHQPGDLHTVTNPAGHVTTIVSYDADGRVTRETDANGINTDLTYTPRGWLASRTVGGAQTTFGYTPYGAVSSVTDPDGVTTSYSYDAAHRLVKVTDAQGNYMQYTLDTVGDKTAEQVYDSTGTLHRSLSRSFNTLGQLTQVTDGLSHTVFNADYSDSYDANGNLVHSADGLGVQRQQSYDALNRLVKTIADYNGANAATANTTTQFAHDGLDRLTQVTDPNSLATTYNYDGLGDVTGQASPDTGSTSRTFDAAGNVLTRTDAKGITATNSYDALDRLATITYPDSTQNIAYHYDEANSVTGCSSSYPIGRLTRIVENAVTTVYCYDAQGRVIEKLQIAGTSTNTTGYAYTAAGRLSGIVYPSGTLVTYTRDGDGRIQSLSVTPPNGTASTAVSNVTYQPFGPVSGYTLGNGQAVVRGYDANYRLTDLTSPAFSLHVARDAMGDITALGNATGANPATESYSYDPLYRLTAITEANGSTLESVTYNQTGDRLTKTGSGLATGTYSYKPNTHQLVATGSYARSVDANGNTTAITAASGNLGFGYNDRNRMVVAQVAGSTVSSYTYDALGERIQKTSGGTASERYGYDEDQQLLSEQGITNRDYVWMDGIPVANVDTTGTTSTIAYVTSDQLGTPRAVADPSGNTLWQLPYQGNAGGEVAPTGTGYTYNLRFAGQYYDAETGLTQNGARDYDSASGRFEQADPTGLNGGINPYVYGLNSPLSYIDPSGLAAQTVPAPAPSPTLPPAPNTGPVPNTGVPANDPEFDPDARPGSVIEACIANPFVCGAVLTLYPTDAGGPQDEAPPDGVNPVVLFPKTRRHIPNQCPVDEDGKEDRCAALYRSSLATCASLTGKKKFMCMAAARKNYEQCMEEE